MPRIGDLDLAKFRLSQILLLIGPLTTLAINPWTSYDPISLPKMFVLCSGSFAILGILLIDAKKVLASLPRIPLNLALVFVASMSLPMLFSGAPLGQQFWGSFGRNTGFLTYFSLVVILLGMIWVRSQQMYLRLSWIFVFTSVPMTFYCLVQMSGNDPIPWSEFNTFGTLGNINFLSAFLGMTSIGAIVFALEKKIRAGVRLSLCALSFLDLYIIISTGSIQGPVIFLVGLVVLLFISIMNFKKFKVIALAIFTTGLVSATYFVIKSFGNEGPLASIIYQPSVVFRGDYMNAGWKMTLDKPLFGVGMDSYGDWYRFARGEISTLRTGPDRVANTAHNIFLDISSNGGVFLGVSYVLLVLFALWCGVKILVDENRNGVVFKLIFSVWVAYQVQALVSINQIGVGIWGWIFTGALIGLRFLSNDEDSSKVEKPFKARSKELRGRPMSARHALGGFLGLAVGLVLSAIPLSADINYRAASDRGNLSGMRKAVNATGATEFHRELVLDFAMRNNLGSEVKDIASELVRLYPRSFFGWRVLSVSALSTNQERLDALLRARELDPFNPDLR